MFLRFVALTLLLSLAPQDPTPPTGGPESQPAASISGTVRSSIDQSPVRKAEVMLLSSERRMMPRRQQPTATTDDSGAYRFEGVEAGRYRLVVRKTGFVDTRPGGRMGRGLEITVGAGQKLTGTDLQLVPAAAITGRVLDEDGEPLEGAQVIALRKGRGGAQRGGFLESERTDDRGEFRLAGLDPGVRYYIAASYTDRTPPASGELRAYQRVFYPSASGPEAATPVSLRPGEERHLDFQLVPARAFRVTGRVIGLDPQNHRGAVLMVTAKDDPPWLGMGGRGFPGGVDVSKPTFDTGPLPPGQYLLRVMAIPKEGDPRMSRAEMAQTEVTVADSDVSDVVLALGDGADINGRLLGAGPEQDHTTLFVSLRPASDALNDTPMMFGPLGMRQSATAKKDGTFTLENIPDGEYLVEVSLMVSEWRDWYVKSIRYGGRDALTEPIRVAGGKAEALEITLSSQGARLSGIARDSAGRPFAGAVVTLIPESRYRRRGDLFVNATTDQNGRFEVRGLRPAEYTLLAWDNDEAREAVREKEFFAKHNSHGKRVSLSAGAQQTVELQVLPLPEDTDE
jgi:hypothetical protein